MPYDATLVGQSTEPILHEVDARWIMSYAAGLNDFNPAYLGTDRAKVVAHPLFPVCLKWLTILSSRHMPGYDTLFFQVLTANAEPAISQGFLSYGGA